MSDRTSAGLVLVLAAASFASYVVGIAYTCWLGMVGAGVVLGICSRIFARNIDPDYSKLPRIARFARSMAQLALVVALLTPLWMFGVGEMLWARRQQGRAWALQEVRALAEAQQSVRKTSGTYVTLECLAGGSRCPAGVKPPEIRFLSEPARGRYRYTFRGVSQPGGRIDAFTYVAAPAPKGSGCDATEDSLVCADSAGRLCRMPAASASEPALDSGKCPASCVDLEGPRPAPSPS